MKDCPFCQKIAREEVDDSDYPVMSFEPLNPVTPGHRLFVPNIHVEHPNGVMVGEAMEAAAHWGMRSGEEFNLITSSGPAATQTIAHIHVHFVPRREGDGLHLPWTGQQK